MDKNTKGYQSAFLQFQRLSFFLKFVKNNGKMEKLDRITFNPKIMGGKACIRGMRVTVGAMVGLMTSGDSFAEILEAYPYVEEEDLRQALTYAKLHAWEYEFELTE